MKVYWSKCGHGHGNFGDKITPMLLKHFGVPVEWTAPEHAELIGVGSILEKVPNNFKGTIWTAGFMHESSHREFSRARVLAVRGRLTLERLTGQSNGNVTLGDGGLLCHELSPSAGKKHKLGLIPHFVDIDDPFVKALADSSRDIRVIDICAEETEVMRTVAECEHIISSSLHGLILADSLEIPNRWLELNRGAEIVTGEGFKYRDYYSVFGLQPQPLRLTGASTLDQVIHSIGPLTRPGLQDVRSALRASISEIQESIRPLSAEEIQAKREAAADWQHHLLELQTIIADIIPQGARVVVADEEQLRGSLSRIEGIPFVERDGIYWGPPGSATEAIDEIQKQHQRGVSWLIIAWPMFWILEKYPGFSAFVHNHFESRHQSAIVRIFQSRSTP